MHKQPSRIHSNQRGRLMGQGGLSIQAEQVTDAAVGALARMGIAISPSIVREQVSALQFGSQGAMVGDSAYSAPITTPSLGTPIQFLQTWLPGFVKAITAARNIDKLIGMQTVGEWAHEEIVATMVEPAGMAQEYGDKSAVPLADWNVNFESRTIVRSELGMSVGMLEEARASAMHLSTADQKRQSAALGLEIWRNAVGFYGWNNGKNRTFGFLNDPNLPAFMSSASGKKWGDPSMDLTQTWEVIQKDIRAAMVQLRVQSGDNINPEDAKMVLALPTSKIDYLSVTTPFGIPVRAWLEQTYKGLRIESAPELQGWGKATGSDTDDCFYLYLEEIDTSVDGSSDGGDVFSQLVVTKFMTYGVEKKMKEYVEDYGAASAGTMCKRPWGVVRVMGI